MISSAAGERGWRQFSRPKLRDIGLAAALCLVDLVAFSSVSPSSAPATFVIAVAGYVPLAWRSIAPVPVFFAIWFLALGSALLLPELRPTLGLLVATYTVAARTDRRVSLALAVLAVISSMTIAIRTELQENPEDPSLSVVFGVAPLVGMLYFGSWALGRWARGSRQRIQDVEAAGQRAAEEARAEERRQIALELHDIISHSVTVMVLQADGARAVLHADPRSVNMALEHISRVGRSTVGELRRLLGILADGTFTVENGISSGLADLPAVIEEAELTGLKVRLENIGRPPQVPASFERSIHRFVTETLANSRKHGGPGTEVSIRLFWSDSLLVVTASDNGSGQRADATLSTGHGLAGLEERIKSLDGRLDAGAGPDGVGYVVTATLPIPTTDGTGPPTHPASTGEQ